MNITDVQSLFVERHSCRAFLPEPPALESLQRAVALASRAAPSSKNGQPWRLVAVLGSAVEPVREALLESFDQGVSAAPDYRYSPDPLPPEMMELAREVGHAIYEHKGIGREDRDARRAHDRENFRLFGAPGFAVLTLPRAAERGTFVDAGIFLGCLSLTLRTEGLESTAMYSVAARAPELRRTMGIGEDRIVVCGIAFGFEDPTARVNTFRTSRLPVSDILTCREA